VVPRVHLDDLSKIETPASAGKPTPDSQPVTLRNYIYEKGNG